MARCPVWRFPVGGKRISVKSDGTRGRYVHSELIHSRFAMAGVAGILIPDVLTHAGLLNVPVWYEQGLVAQQGSFAPFSARPHIALRALKPIVAVVFGLCIAGVVRAGPGSAAGLLRALCAPCHALLFLLVCLLAHAVQQGAVAPLSALLDRSSIALHCARFVLAEADVRVVLCKAKPLMGMTGSQLGHVGNKS